VTLCTLKIYINYWKC